MKYLISFNNYLAYEENRVTAVCVASNKKTAGSTVKSLTEWLKERRDEHPEVASHLAHDVWVDEEHARRARIEKIKCPYQCTALREGVQYLCGKFIVEPLPDA